MARGDVKSAIASIAAAGFQDINPPAGEEWVIHNIYHEAAVTLDFFDGVNSIPFDSVTGKGIYAKYQFHVKNGVRLRVKNDDAAAKLIGYDGIQTK
ncbi:MAG: hypothetical protein ACRD2A_07400 [Vicinamibacterales bacterium]